MEAQRAVQQYQRANGMYLAAKETVSLAEERMQIIEDNTHQLEPAWQDMLNHATIKVQVNPCHAEFILGKAKMCLPNLSTFWLWG